MNRWRNMIFYSSPRHGIHSHHPIPTPSAEQKICAAEEKKRFLRGIFHTFYVQLMYDAVVWVSFMLFSWGDGEEWMKMGHLLITKYDHFFLSWFRGPGSACISARRRFLHCCCNLLGILVSSLVVKITLRAHWNRWRSVRKDLSFGTFHVHFIYCYYS